MSRFSITPPSIEEPQVILELDGLYLFAARQHLKRVDPAKTRIRRLTQRLIRLNEELGSYTDNNYDDDDEHSYNPADYHDEIMSLGSRIESTYYDLVRAFRPSWQHCAEAMILAAFSVEAHMNRRIIELVTARRTRTRLTNASPPYDKMQKILDYLGKRKFGRSNKTFLYYKDVVNYRNRLAHYKPLLMFYDDGRPPKLPEELGLIPREARKAVRVAEVIIESFSQRLGVDAPSWIRRDLDHFFDFV